MTKAWMLTAGEYSDYRVHAVYTTKEAADKAALFFNSKTERVWDYLFVEETHIDPPIEMVTYYSKNTKGEVTATEVAPFDIGDEDEVVVAWSRRHVSGRDLEAVEKAWAAWERKTGW